MQRTKLSLFSLIVLAMGVGLAGCSVRDGLNSLQKPAAVDLEISPAVTMEVSADRSPAPVEPTQSPSTEVLELEADLKAVQFDQESFE